MLRKIFTMTAVAPLLLAGHVNATDVAGDQSGTWTLAGSPYHLVGDVRVPPGEILTIDSGVEIIALGHYKLTVDGGTLLAVGLPGAEILMTAEDTGQGWRGLRILAADDATLIGHCIIEYAKGTGGYPEVRGGGIYIQNCSPTVEYCLLRHNYSHNASYNGTGGGICTESSDALIQYNTIIDNIADSGGGVCTLEYGTPIVRANTIADNTAYYAGGGLYFGARSSPLIDRNIIESNHATGGWGGGGINSWTSFIYYSTYAVIRNNLIIHNTANDGGGLYCRYDKAVLINNTIAYNSATGSGGGIYALNYPAQAPDVRNTILWGNSAGSGKQVYLEGSTGSAITVTYCDVQGGWSGTGNINVNPNFADAPGEDFHIASGSPCIDAGTNYGVPRDMIVDLDGNPRFVDDPDTDDTGAGPPPIVDMGCYEYQVSEPCPADITGDDMVDVLDLLEVLGQWGGAGSADITGDGVVDVLDLLEVLGAWGPCR